MDLKEEYLRIIISLMRIDKQNIFTLTYIILCGSCNIGIFNQLSIIQSLFRL
jgi:hypothetical protein